MTAGLIQRADTIVGTRAAAIAGRDPEAFNDIEHMDDGLAACRAFAVGTGLDPSELGAACNIVAAQVAEDIRRCGDLEPVLRGAVLSMILTGYHARRLELEDGEA